MHSRLMDNFRVHHIGLQQELGKLLYRRLLLTTR